MARFVSSFLFLLMVMASFSGGFPALAKETAAPDSPGELTRLKLLAQTAAGPETNQVLRLRGADARQQLLVTASFSTGALRDFTREVSYQTSPAGVIQVSKTGRVTPLAEGTATITAKIRTPHPDPLHEPGSSRRKEAQSGSEEEDQSLLTSAATLPVTVEQFKNVPTVNFPNQIVPIFTKAGCNAGGCHGKSSGQNGF